MDLRRIAYVKASQVPNDLAVIADERFIEQERRYGAMFADNAVTDDRRLDDRIFGNCDVRTDDAVDDLDAGMQRHRRDNDTVLIALYFRYISVLLSKFQQFAVRGQDGIFFTAVVPAVNIED